MLVHPGTFRLEATLTSRLEGALRQAYCGPNLRKDAEHCCKHCHTWQLVKKQKKKYRKLPSKKAEEGIWNRVNVDLWEPASVDNKKDGKLKIHLMAMMDPVLSYWFDAVPIRGNPNSYECNHIFDVVGLSRYLVPQLVGSDGGNEFQLHFEEL